MAKKGKQFCLEACAIKKLHPVASRTDSVSQFVDVVKFLHLQHLDTIRQPAMQLTAICEGARGLARQTVIPALGVL